MDATNLHRGASDIRILNRDIGRYARRIPEIHMYLWYALKCFFVFKKPLPFLRAYVTAGRLPGDEIELRNGLKLHLLVQPDDVITAFLVFVREDYGPVHAQSVVVDIGASIGAFALWAACRDASTVLAFEPNSATYSCMVQNIQANKLEHVIFAHHQAVTGRAGDQVRFPVKPSVYNAIVVGDATSDVETVETTDLSAIVAGFPRVDLLKLDCEGAEYDILLSASAAVLDKVREIRMEYHLGRAAELITFLQNNGFSLSRQRADTQTSGSMWFERI